MPAAAVARSLAALHSLLYYRVSNEKKNVHRSSSYLKVYLLYMDVAAEFRAWILVGVHHHYCRNCQVLPINYGVVLFLYNESSLKFDMQLKVGFWLTITKTLLCVITV